MVVQVVLWPVLGMSVPQIAGLVSAGEDGVRAVRGGLVLRGGAWSSSPGLLVAEGF